MKTHNRLLFALAAPLIAAVPASTQTIVTDPTAHLASSIAGRAAQIEDLRVRALTAPLGPAETPSATINLSRDIDRIYLSLIPEFVQRSPQALEELRVDKQVGDAAGSAAGSTSLVSKGGTPAILALAVENGALAQDVNGTTVTFRGTPAGIIKAIGNKG